MPLTCEKGDDGSDWTQREVSEGENYVYPLETQAVELVTLEVTQYDGVAGNAQDEPEGNEQNGLHQ